MSKKEHILTIRMDKQDIDALSACACAEGITKSAYIRKILQAWKTETPSCSTYRQEDIVCLNEIYHQIKKYGNPQLESTVRNLLNGKDIQNGGLINEERQ